jgi:hypothetical protein
MSFDRQIKQQRQGVLDLAVIIVKRRSHEYVMGINKI